MNLGLSGKNAIITGASKGIGKSIALALAGEGANVAICARGEEAPRSVEKEIIKKGVKVMAATCEVGNLGLFKCGNPSKLNLKDPIEGIQS